MINSKIVLLLQQILSAICISDSYILNSMMPWASAVYLVWLRCLRWGLWVIVGPTSDFENWSENRMLNDKCYHLCLLLIIGTSCYGLFEIGRTPLSFWNVWREPMTSSTTLLKWFQGNHFTDRWSGKLFPTGLRRQVGSQKVNPMEWALSGALFSLRAHVSHLMPLVNAANRSLSESLLIFSGNRLLPVSSIVYS